MTERRNESGIIIVNGVDELRGMSGFSYLASPYSRFIDGLAAAYAQVHHISDALWRAGVKHFCPIVSSHETCLRSGINNLDHDFWMTVDRPFMERATSLVVAGMDGWEQSLGIIAERAHFSAAGKPIYFLEPAIILASDHGTHSIITERTKDDKPIT